jgi:hypothetical protein
MKGLQNNGFANCSVLELFVCFQFYCVTTLDNDDTRAQNTPWNLSPRNSNSALSKGDKTLSHCVGALAHSFHVRITQTDHDQKDQGFLTLFYKFLCNEHQSAVLKRKSHSFYGWPSWSGECGIQQFSLPHSFGSPSW